MHRLPVIMNCLLYVLFVTSWNKTICYYLNQTKLFGLLFIEMLRYYPTFLGTRNFNRRWHLSLGSNISLMIYKLEADRLIEEIRG